MISLNSHVEALAEFARTRRRPPLLVDMDASYLTVMPTPTPTPLCYGGHGGENLEDKGRSGKRLYLQTSIHSVNDFDHSVRSPYNNNNSRSWTPSHSGVM